LKSGKIELEQELIRLLYREVGEIQTTVRGERLHAWSEAYEHWMTKRKDKFSLNVGEDTHLAWKELLAFCRRPRWEIEADDMYRRPMKPGSSYSHL